MTNAELAVLSLIAEAPRHGYEVEQVIEARGMREWTEIGFSSIYYVLKKLKADGWIVGRKERGKGRGPDRLVYRVTEQGRRRLRQGLLEALSEPARCYSPLQIGLANAPALPRHELVHALASYRDNLRERRLHVEARRDAQAPLPWFVEAMFEHSLAMIEAERTWVATFLQRLEPDRDKS